MLHRLGAGSGLVVHVRLQPLRLVEAGAGWPQRMDPHSTADIHAQVLPAQRIGVLLGLAMPPAGQVHLGVSLDVGHLAVARRAPGCLRWWGACAIVTRADGRGRRMPAWSVVLLVCVGQRQSTARPYLAPVLVGIAREHHE